MTMRHVVCFRFHPGTTPDQVAALAKGLHELPALIPEIAAYRVGPDLGLADTSWDFAVTADFAGPSDFMAYREHPDHQERIASLLVPITAERAAVQFDI